MVLAPCSPDEGPTGGPLPVIVDDEGDGFEEDGVLGVGVLHLLGLGRLLGLVQDGLQTLHQPALDGAVLRRRVALQQAQQLAGQPGRRDKVVGVVLEVRGGRRHDLQEGGKGFKAFALVFAFALQ